MEATTVQAAAAELGIDSPYVARLVGARVEFHLRSGRILVWRPVAALDRPTLQAMKLTYLRRLAGRYRVVGRGRLRKADLIDAILEQIEENKNENCRG